MKNYDKLWKNWQQKTILNELDKKNRKKLVNYVQKTMDNLGSDSLDILTRTPFNYAFGNKLRLVIPLEENVALKLAEHIAFLKLKINEFYQKKVKDGSINEYFIPQFSVVEETVQQSIEGGRDTKEVKIRTPQVTIKYKNKMDQLKVETYPLGRVFNKFKMDEASRYWSQVQSGLVTNEEMTRQLQHFESMIPVTTTEHITNTLKSLGGSTENYSIVVTRSPIDVARMSDFPNISSCHSQKGSYFICALEEAKRGGAVAYIVRTEDVKKLEQEGRMQDAEIFFDEEHLDQINKDKKTDPNAPMRFDYEISPGDDFDVGEEQQPTQATNKILPISRIRIRRVIDLEKQLEYMIPEESEYGKQIYKFRQTLMEWCANKQAFLFNKDGKVDFDFSKAQLILTGGSYQDTQITSLFLDQLERIAGVLGVKAPDEDTELYIDWEGNEDPLEDASDCERNTNLYRIRQNQLRLVANFMIVESSPKCNEDEILTGYEIKLNIALPFSSLNIKDEYREYGSIKTINKELQKISSALSEYSQAFGILQDVVGGGNVLVLKYIRTLTSIDDFADYDVNCVKQTHSNILTTVRRVLIESGISKESELKSQEIYSLLSETEDNPKFKVEFDPESSYKFIYNSDNKPETYNSRYRNWFMGSHPITPYVENPPQQKLFNQNQTSKLNIKQQLEQESETDPLIEFPSFVTSLINLNPQTYRTVINSSLEATFAKLNSIIATRRGTNTMFPNFEEKDQSLESFLGRQMTIGDGAHLSFDAFFTDYNKGINVIVQGSCLSSVRSRTAQQFASLVNWISKNTELIEDTFHKIFVKQIGEANSNIAKAFETGPRVESEKEVAQHQNDLKFGGSKEKIVRTILDRVITNYADKLEEIPVYTVGENNEPGIKFFPTAVGHKGEIVFHFRYGVFTDENTIAASVVTTLNKVFFTKVETVSFPMTAEQTAAVFDGFVEDIKKVLGPYYSIFTKESQQVKENRTINKKLLREKLIRWYRRNK